MPRYQYVPDPTDPLGEPMIVDLDDRITIGKPQQWCETCKGWVDYTENGRWTFWAQEPDKWWCEEHK
jgi:hypothetical protein